MWVDKVSNLLRLKNIKFQGDNRDMNIGHKNNLINYAIKYTAIIRNEKYWLRLTILDYKRGPSCHMSLQVVVGSLRLHAM